VEAAEPDFPRSSIEIYRLVRMRIDPQRRIDGPATIAIRGFGSAPRSAARDLDEPSHEQPTYFVDPYVATPA
jgi:hypothetical protein